jgi:hypothetical protein
MGKRRKRMRDVGGCDDARARKKGLLIPPPGFAEDLLGALSGFDDSFLRLCPRDDCQRSRDCLTDAKNCAVEFEDMVEWLRHALKAGCAGLSTVEAGRAANRHVLALRNRAESSPGATNTRAVR